MAETRRNNFVDQIREAVRKLRKEGELPIAEPAPLPGAATSEEPHYERVCPRCRRVCFSPEEFHEHNCFDMDQKLEAELDRVKLVPTHPIVLPPDASGHPITLPPAAEQWREEVFGSPEKPSNEGEKQEKVKIPSALPEGKRRIQIAKPDSLPESAVNKGETDETKFAGGSGTEPQK